MSNIDFFCLFVFYLLFCLFRDKVPPLAQASLKLTMWLKFALNSWSSCFGLIKSFKIKIMSGMVACAYDIISWESKAGGFWVWGQPQVLSEILFLENKTQGLAR